MPRFEHDELRQRYALVIEGHCPNGHGELERRTECGWCSECGMGWSVRGEEVTAHFDVNGMQLDGRDICVPGRITHVRWTSTTFD